VLLVAVGFGIASNLSSGGLDGDLDTFVKFWFALTLIAGAASWFCRLSFVLEWFIYLILYNLCVRIGYRNSHLDEMAGMLYVIMHAGATLTVVLVCVFGWIGHIQSRMLRSLRGTSR